MTVTQHLDELRDYKEHRGCADCKTNFPHYVLEFDHRPGTKKLGNVYHVLKKYGIEKARQEIKKCDVVCSNCHKIRTYTRQEALVRLAS
jgi:hypothetical protein